MLLFQVPRCYAKQNGTRTVVLSYAQDKQDGSSDGLAGDFFEIGKSGSETL